MQLLLQATLVRTGARERCYRDQQRNVVDCVGHQGHANARVDRANVDTDAERVGSRLYLRILTSFLSTRTMQKPMLGEGRVALNVGL